MPFGYCTLRKRLTLQLLLKYAQRQLPLPLLLKLPLPLLLKLPLPLGFKSR